MSPSGETASLAFDEAARCLAELGHPHRLHVFHLLIRAGDAGLSVGEIQSVLGIPKSTLAHHISALVSAGLMAQRREGRIQRCKVDRRTLFALTGADHNIKASASPLWKTRAARIPPISRP